VDGEGRPAEAWPKFRLFRRMYRGILPP
jgi:hypothetical protein